MVDEFKAEHPGITAVWDREVAAKPVNLTGLSRNEIRLLAEAVGVLVSLRDRSEASGAWAASVRIDKMKAVIRKLKVASGYNFSGRKKR